MSIPIGDYVHLHQLNYINLGIKRNKKDKKQGKDLNWQAAQQAVLNKTRISELNQLKLNLKKANKMEEEMNKMFYPKKGDNDAIAYRDSMIDIVQEILQEEYGVAAGKISSDWSINDSERLYQEVFSKIQMTRNNIKIASVNADNTSRQLQNRIKKIWSLLETMEGSGTSSELASKINQAKQELKDISSRLTKGITKKDMKGNQNLKPLGEQDLISLEKMIHVWNRLAPIANQGGDIWEWLIPFIAYKGTNIAKEELRDNIKDFIKASNLGASTSTIEYMDLLSVKDLEVAFGDKNYKFDTKETKVRNKTDVRFQYEIPGIDTNTQNYNISAKNVKNRKEIKLVDSTSLYRILAFSQGVNLNNNMAIFATHYLNIITTSSEGGSAQRSEIVNANRLIKGLILKIAAEGYDVSLASDLLVVNSQSEEHVYVYSIKALVHILSQLNEGNQSAIQKSFVKSADFDDGYTIDQDFEESDSVEEGIKSRISSVIAKLNSTKISVILSLTDLQKYANFLAI